jgi:hypothetical protein
LRGARVGRELAGAQFRPVRSALRRHRARCGDHAGVIGQIPSKFAHKEGEYWNSNLEIVGIDRIRETAFRPLARQAIPTPVLQRRRRTLRRLEPADPLLDQRDRQLLGSGGGSNGAWSGSTAKLGL